MVLLAIALSVASSSFLAASVEAQAASIEAAPVNQPCPPSPPDCHPPPPPPPSNRAPAFFGATPADGASLVVLSGGELGFVVEAQDPEGDVVQLSVTGLPAGASFPIPQPAASVRTSFRWTPTREQVRSSPYALTFTATDASGATASRRVSVTVNAANAAPVIQSPANGSALEGAVGQTITFTLAASDPDTDQLLNFQISPPITCVGGPPANPLRTTCSFTPSQEGTVGATVTVTDGRSPVTSAFSIVTGAPAAPPPVVAPPVEAPSAPKSWQLVVTFVSGAARATTAPSTCAAGTECVVPAPQDACGGASPCDVIASSRCDETGSCETSVAGASCGDEVTCPASRVAFGCGASGTTCGPTIALARRAWDIAVTILFGGARYSSATTKCVAGSSCGSSVVVPAATCGGPSDCVFTGTSDCEPSGACGATLSGAACGSTTRCLATTARFSCGAGVCGPVFDVVRPAWDLIVGFNPVLYEQRGSLQVFVVGPPMSCAAGEDCVVTGAVPADVCGADAPCAVRVEARCDATGSCEATVSGCSLCRPAALRFSCAEPGPCRAEFTVEAPMRVPPLWHPFVAPLFGEATAAVWILGVAILVLILVAPAQPPLFLAGIALTNKWWLSGVGTGSAPAAEVTAGAAEPAPTIAPEGLGERERTIAATEGAGCFIATAAYGSELAPEVQFLRDIRDKVLRRTRWGREFFLRYWSYYYRMSPAIAGKMHKDPEFRRIVGWSIVTPFTNYLKLAVTQPNWDRVDMDALDPEVRTFVARVRADLERWLASIELPRDFARRDPFEAVGELNIILNYIVRSGGLRYLDELVAAGELPLRYHPKDVPRLLAALRAAGRDADEIRRILRSPAGGTS